MSLFAVVPVKHLDRAKSRLAGAIPDRPALVLALLGTVLAALRGAPGVDRILVTSPDPRVQAHCLDATFVLQRGRGLNPALEEARRLAVASGASAILVVLADLGELSARSIQDLLDSCPTGPAVVAAPDRLGTGTNALLLRPAGQIPFRFGRDSLRQHRREARRRGVPLILFRHPETMRDVDTLEHLGEVCPSVSLPTITVREVQPS